MRLACLSVFVLLITSFCAAQSPRPLGPAPVVWLSQESTSTVNNSIGVDTGGIYWDDLFGSKTYLKNLATSAAVAAGYLPLTAGAGAALTGILAANEGVSVDGTTRISGTGVATLAAGSTVGAYTVDEDFATTASDAAKLPLAAGSGSPVTGSLHLTQSTNGYATLSDSNMHIRMKSLGGTRPGYDIRSYEFISANPATTPRMLVRPNGTNMANVMQFMPNGTSAPGVPFNPQTWLELFGTDYSADSSNYQICGIGHDGTNMIFGSKDIGTYAPDSPMVFMFGDAYRVLKLNPGGLATFSGVNRSTNDVILAVETYSTGSGAAYTPNYGTTTATTTVFTVDAEGDVTGNSFAGNGSALTNLDAGDVAAGTLAVTRGGTGLASYAVGDLIYASAGTTLAKLAGVATGNVLLSGGVTTAPAWGKVGLATHVSGTLPAANLPSVPIIPADDVQVYVRMRGNDTTGLPNVITGTAATSVNGSPAAASVITDANSRSSVGKCLTFDGSDDWISYGDNFDQTTNDFTIAFWFKCTLTGTVIFCDKRNAGYTGFSIEMTSAGAFRMFMGTGSGTSDTSIGTGYDDGNWHHAVFSFDRDANLLSYVDGALVDTTNISGASAQDISNADNFYIGRSRDNNGFFPGQLDEFVLFTRALTADEARRLYLHGTIVAD